MVNPDLTNYFRPLSKTLRHILIEIEIYLFLFHKFGIRTIVDDIFSKAGRGQYGVDFLGVNVLELPVQNELVSLGPKIDCDLPSQKNECEDITVLCEILAGYISVSEHRHAPTFA